MTAEELLKALQDFIAYHPDNHWHPAVSRDGDFYYLHPAIVPEGVDWSGMGFGDE